MLLSSRVLTHLEYTLTSPCRIILLVNAIEFPPLAIAYMRGWIRRWSQMEVRGPVSAPQSPGPPLYCNYEIRGSVDRMVEIRGLL